MKNGSWRKKTYVCIVIVVLLILGGSIFLLKSYEIEQVYVEGNVHYSADEIEEMVMSGRFGNNSLLLSLQYQDKKIHDVPFIETVEVQVIDRHTVKIRVFEKSLAGYVEFLNQYFYFDKDGMVVESSKVKTTGIPQVSGLWFDYIVLNQYLPIEDKTVFQRILKITQAMDKYDLLADKIVFDRSMNATVHFGNVRVKMGDDSVLDDQCSVLQEILPNLEGKSGVLNMDSDASITFKNDVKEDEVSESTESAESEETIETEQVLESG